MDGIFFEQVMIYSVHIWGQFVISLSPNRQGSSDSTRSSNDSFTLLLADSVLSRLLVFPNPLSVQTTTHRLGETMVIAFRVCMALYLLVAYGFSRVDGFLNIKSSTSENHTGITGTSELFVLLLHAW
mmetsp:Transcript_12419/g.25276  ORF Transcript_12419/g.25276 Transcript_12419/m.25276 type:complete len:127 (-) Transcript_12419:529-909(-)